MGIFITQQEIITINHLVQKGELTQQDAEDAIILGTPALWMETYLNNPDDPTKPITLRPYQNDALKDVNSVCINWGRQIGKTFSLAGRLLWEADTEPNSRCLVFAPRKKHISDLFNYIEKMVMSSEIADHIVKGTKTKVRITSKTDDNVDKIEFTNGSVILFFWTQSKTALETIRGTIGGKVFLDEAAYIDEDAFAAMSGIFTSAKKPFIYAQSTPKGSEGWYYEFSQSADIYSHHTSRESPTWTEEKEKAARLLAPDEGTFDREQLAKFVSDGWSAFTSDSIDKSVESSIVENGDILFRDNTYFSTEQVEKIPGNVYIGIDWNISSNGTKIIIMKEPLHKLGSLIYQKAISIEHPKYTQLTAIDTLFEIVNKLKPKAIAIDKGYAATAIEIIGKKLEEPQYEYLMNSFDIVDFREVIHIPINEFFGSVNQFEEDLSTEETENNYSIKMPMKSFMVSVLTRMLLSDNMMIPPLDINIEKKTFASELKSVRIDKISAAGYPVYSKKNLHKFAAGILCVYAFFKIKGGYYIVQENNKKVLHKDLSTTFDTTSVLGLGSISRTAYIAEKIGTPITISRRTISKPKVENKRKMSREDYSDLGINVSDAKISNINENRSGYLSHYGRSKHRGTRSLKR